MQDVFLATGVALALLMLASTWRGIKGPTVLDRILCVNAIGSKTTVLLICIGFLYERVDMFVDISLAYAMLNFIGVVAAARYFRKRNEPLELPADPEES